MTSDLPHEDSKSFGNDTIDFTPNRIFYVIPHYGWTKVIKVLELTAMMKAKPGTDDFTKEAKQIVKASPPDLYLVASKEKWYSKHRSIYLPARGEDSVAEWKAGHTSRGNTSITFSPESPFSSHTITMRTVIKMGVDEEFVQDSVPYVWKVKSWASHKFKLYKKISGREQEVGRYRQSLSWGTGGMLVLKGDEVNDVVGIITCLVMLWKKRQRNAERRM